MVDRLITEHTSGHIVTSDGTILDRPARVLDTETATIVRNYFFWALRSQLEPELFCGDCGRDFQRSDKATYDINESQIIIVCGCAQRFYQGPTPLTKTTLRAGVPAPETEDVPSVWLLPGDAARLLRLYKKVLLSLNLKEALRCNACYDLGLPDGCDAQVLTNRIQIRCRCTDRQYLGMTI